MTILIIRLLKQRPPSNDPHPIIRAGPSFFSSSHTVHTGGPQGRTYRRNDRQTEVIGQSAIGTVLRTSSMELGLTIPQFFLKQLQPLTTVNKELYADQCSSILSSNSGGKTRTRTRLAPANNYSCVYYAS